MEIYLEFKAALITAVNEFSKTHVFGSRECRDDIVAINEMLDDMTQTSASLLRGKVSKRLDRMPHNPFSGAIFNWDQYKLYIALAKVLKNYPESTLNSLENIELRERVNKINSLTSSADVVKEISRLQANVAICTEQTRIAMASLEAHREARDRLLQEHSRLLERNRELTKDLELAAHQIKILTFENEELKRHHQSDQAEIAELHRQLAAANQALSALPAQRQAAKLNH